MISAFTFSDGAKPSVLGCKIYYGDGSVASSKDTAWELLPSINVQVMLVFVDRAYQIYYPEDGWRTEYYRFEFSRGDYYWQWGTGNLTDVPIGATVKTGKLLLDTDFMVIYNKSLADRTWP